MDGFTSHYFYLILNNILTVKTANYQNADFEKYKNYSEKREVVKTVNVMASQK
jgi:hypothetical protein